MHSSCTSCDRWKQYSNHAIFISYQLLHQILSTIPPVHCLIMKLGDSKKKKLLDDFEIFECSSDLFYVFMDLNTYCLGLPEINFQNSQQPAIQEPTWQRKGIQYFPMKTQRRRWPLFLKKHTNFYCWKNPQMFKTITRNYYGQTRIL